MDKKAKKVEEPKEAKIIATKKWTIEINFYDDGSQRLKRTNEGFNPYELLGLSFKSQIEILDQISGKITPTITERIVK